MYAAKYKRNIKLRRYKIRIFYTKKNRVKEHTRNRFHGDTLFELANW